MIRQEMFLNEQAIMAENTFLKVVCLPGFGGKLVSLFDKRLNKEFLFQNPHETFRHAETGSDFSDFEACGLDDAFPSVDAGSVLVNNSLVEYPDHGEVWSASFTQEDNPEVIALTYKSSLLPYRYSKIISLDEESLLIRYRITNTGQFSFPCIWTLHCLLAYEEDMTLVFPLNTQEAVCALSSTRMGSQGTVHPFPITQTPEKGILDFRKVDSPNIPCMEKFYIHHKVSEGRCGVRYGQSNTALWFEYDEEKLPYLGFWKTLGGYRGDFNCALEPSNGYYDSIERAKHYGDCPQLAPNEEVSFSIRIQIEQE